MIDTGWFYVIAIRTGLKCFVLHVVWRLNGEFVLLRPSMTLYWSKVRWMKSNMSFQRPKQPCEKPVRRSCRASHCDLMQKSSATLTDTWTSEESGCGTLYRTW